MLEDKTRYIDTTPGWATAAWDKSLTKYQQMVPRIGSKIPYIPENGRYTDKGEDTYWWTNGFYAGLLWEL
ncbi:hypothetical protein [Schleiferilactobacillus harbinensis]|nr:hypothetical protein [Schleiferilactobacillus harbinensis]